MGRARLKPGADRGNLFEVAFVGFGSQWRRDSPLRLTTLVKPAPDGPGGGKPVSVGEPMGAVRDRSGVEPVLGGLVRRVMGRILDRSVIRRH